MWSKNVNWDVPWTEMLENGPGKEATQEYDTGCVQNVCGFWHVTLMNITCYMLH